MASASGASEAASARISLELDAPLLVQVQAGTMPYLDAMTEIGKQPKHALKKARKLGLKFTLAMISLSKVAPELIWDALKPLEEYLSDSSLDPLVRQVFEMGGMALAVTESMIDTTTDSLRKQISEHFEIDDWKIYKDNFVEYFPVWMYAALMESMKQTEILSKVVIRSLPLSASAAQTAEGVVSAIVVTISEAVKDYFNASDPLSSSSSSASVDEREMQPLLSVSSYKKTVTSSSSSSSSSGGTSGLKDSDFDPSGVTYEIPGWMVDFFGEEAGSEGGFPKIAQIHKKIPLKSRAMLFQRAVRKSGSEESITEAEALAELVYGIITVSLKTTKQFRIQKPASKAELKVLTSDVATYVLQRKPEGLTKEEYIATDIFAEIIQGFVGFKVTAASDTTTLSDDY